TTFALLCPRSPGLTPRSLFGYSIVDSLIVAFCIAIERLERLERLERERSDNRRPHWTLAGASGMEEKFEIFVEVRK
ncbi:MAG TPA: hypothetical protein VIH18_16800, partial [Candidatus Binatia bacterium]